MSSQGWWNDIQDAARGLGGTTGATGGGAPPPPSVAGDTTLPPRVTIDGPQGYGLYVLDGPNGTPGTFLGSTVKPTTSGGGSVSVSLDPNSTSAWSIREMPDGSLWRINELTGEMVQMTGAPKQGLPGEVYPGAGVTAQGISVHAIPSSMSPTGYMLADGTIVYPNGAPYGGNVYDKSNDVPGWSNVTKGPGGMYGINNQTGAYGLIPGSEALGSAASNQPATYSGGGGGSGAASAYSSIATAQINAASRLAAIDAESQAAQAELQMEAQLTKELKALDQNFQREMAAMQNTLSAIGLQAQIATANAQLRQAYEQNKIALVGQFQSALQQYDARAVFDAMMEAGSLSSALNQMGEQGFLTDNANAPAAALLSMIRKPFEPIPEPAALAGFLGGAPGGGGMTGGLPGGTTGGATGGTGGTGGVTGTTGGLSGGLGGVPVGVGGSVDTVQIARDLRAQGVPEAEIAAMMREMEQGQAAVSEAALSAAYQQYTGQGQYLTHDAQGNPTIAGYGQGGMHTLQQADPWFSGVWQTSDPYAPNYKSPNDPMFQPSWAKQTQPTSGMAGAGGNFVAPTEPIPANHPLAGGLTGGQTKPQNVVIPMLAGGGMAHGAFITGDHPSGIPTGNEELVITEGPAQVIPLNRPMAGQLMGALPRFATGTPSYLQGMDWWSLSQQAQQEPVYEAPKYEAPKTVSSTRTVQPLPWQTTATTGGSVTTSVPSTTTQAAPPLASSPVVSPTSSPAPPVAAPTPAAPAATTTPAQPATQPTTTPTPTTPLNGSLPQPSQELLDEIMADRMGTANMGINPYDVGFANLPPWIQELFFRNEQQRTGTPAALYAQDVARRQLPGALVGTLGY